MSAPKKSTKNLLSLTQIKATLRELAFNPRTPPWNIKADVGNRDYYLGTVQVALGELATTPSTSPTYGIIVDEIIQNMILVKLSK